MRFTLTKIFHFSASYADGGKVYGHNYTLAVTSDAMSLSEEHRVVENLEERLIKKIGSRDLGLHVDFLKGVALSDQSLLKAFWPIVRECLEPHKLLSLSLERDNRTRLVYTEIP